MILCLRMARAGAAVFLLGLTFGVFDVRAQQPAAPKHARPDLGEPKISGKEPASQKEADWVDNRWAQTDIGPFLASSMRFPGGVTIAKALTVKAGAGSVVYDTATMTLAGGWTGGLVVPEAGRFGLIGAPKPAGEVLQPGPMMRWPIEPVRFLALHRGASATVLEYEVNSRRILETADVREIAGNKVFIRQLEIGPGTNAVLLPVGAEAVAVEVPVEGRLHRVLLRTGDKSSSGLVLPVANEDGVIPAGDSLRAWLFWTTGNVTRESAKEFIGHLALGGPLPSALAKAGPARWLPASATRGQLGASTGPLIVDTVTVPYDNPWKALMFLAGVDFTSNGDCFVCTIHGDVWRVTGVDRTLSKLTWKRYATGLYQPLGLKVMNDQVYVLGRDRITRLKDLNEDGEADTYENFCDLIATSSGGHDYVTSLETDSAGHFYYVDPKGAHRVSPDGKRLETIATGFRNPNGMGVRPDGGVITVAPQQGEWTPSSFIGEIRPGGYFGYAGPKITEARPQGYDAPLCWLPHGVDNSSGGQAWIPEGKWGPLGGQMIHLSWGRCFPMVVLRDTSGPVSQGAAMALPAKFLSGPNRATWSERDQALYVVGSTGWQTSAVKDGALQRIRWAGKSIAWPIAWTARKGGIELKFSAPLRRETAEDSGSYGLKWWNYRYAAQYGSKDWSVAAPDREGRDEVPIGSAKLSADGSTIFLTIPGMRPVMQFELKWNLEEAGGRAAPGTIYGTINGLR